MSDFTFYDYDVFTDGEIEVVVTEKTPANDELGYSPQYGFTIRLSKDHQPVGGVNLRIGNTIDIVKYAGHIGYGINEIFRGHHYAAKACELIKPVALDHGFRTLWITCNPDNYPSRRTCEILGCELIEIVDLPEDNDQYRDGERQKCRYRWDIG